MSAGMSFKELDFNNDGRLTEKEVKKALEAEFGTRMDVSVVEDLFGEINGFDTEGLTTNRRNMASTGAIAALLIETLDSRELGNGNGNGTVSLVEARRAGMLIEPEEPEVPTDAPFAFDDARNDDQFVTWREASDATLETADLNGDGEIGEEEWDEANLGETLGVDFILTDMDDSNGIGLKELKDFYKDLFEELGIRRMTRDDYLSAFPVP